MSAVNVFATPFNQPNNVPAIIAALLLVIMITISLLYLVLNVVVACHLRNQRIKAELEANQQRQAVQMVGLTMAPYALAQTRQRGDTKAVDERLLITAKPVVEYFQERQLKVFKSSVCSPVTASDGHYLNAYERIANVDALVESKHINVDEVKIDMPQTVELCERSHNVVKRLTRKRSSRTSLQIHQISELLCSRSDMQLVTYRHLVSFPNGVYDCQNDTFRDAITVCSKFVNVNHPMGTQSAHATVSRNWFKLNTNKFDHVMQGFDMQGQFHVYAFIGKLFLSSSSVGDHVSLRVDCIDPAVFDILCRLLQQFAIDPEDFRTAESVAYLAGNCLETQAPSSPPKWNISVCLFRYSLLIEAADHHMTERTCVAQHRTFLPQPTTPWSDMSSDLPNIIRKACLAYRCCVDKTDVPLCVRWFKYVIATTHFLPNDMWFVVGEYLFGDMNWDWDSGEEQE